MTSLGASGLSLSLPPSTGILSTSTCTCGFWVLMTLVPHASTASTLMTDPSAQLFEPYLSGRQWANLDGNGDLWPLYLLPCHIIQTFALFEAVFLV